MTEACWNAERPDGVATLADLFDWRVRHSPAAVAYCEYDAGRKVWEEFSWHEIDSLVTRKTAVLTSMGLPHGARVAILLPNGVDAVCTDLAVLRAGMVPVPMHALDNPQSIAYILGDSQAALLFVPQVSAWTHITALCKVPATLRQVVVTQDMDEIVLPDTPKVESLASWLEAGTGDGIRSQAQVEDLAAIVYTSGTTGRPKGVMLSHRNVLTNVGAVLELVRPRMQDVFLSILPLSHTFERTIGYYLPMASGSCVTYTRSIADIAEDLLKIRPTVLVSVPRIYERVLARMQQALAQAGAPVRRGFDLTASIGWRRFCRRQGMHPPAGGTRLTDWLAWPFLRFFVARRMLALFGGRLRIAVSGGAPLSPAVAQTFIGMGLPILQGYGMTETAPVVCANSLDDNWPATVGRPLRGVEVRLGELDELQVRGANVMRGYWHLPEASATAFTADGWLRTGDRAAIEGGRIRIVGRLKEIIVTSTGEKIAPADLELAITSDPLFEQAMVVGEQQSFIAAFVVLGRSGWHTLARELGLDENLPASLAAPALRSALLERVRVATGSFPYYAMPRVVVPLLESWTVENGLMTPTLKLKRMALQSRLAAEISRLYARPGANAAPSPATKPPGSTR